MQNREKQITADDIQTAMGDEDAKRTMLSWLSGGTAVLYNESGSAITLMHPNFGPMGLLDLNTGEMATDTPVQGETESIVSEELLLLARTVCGLNS